MIHFWGFLSNSLLKLTIWEGKSLFVSGTVWIHMWICSLWDLSSTHGLSLPQSSRCELCPEIQLSSVGRCCIAPWTSSDPSCSSATFLKFTGGLVSNTWKQLGVTASAVSQLTFCDTSICISYFAFWVNSENTPSHWKDFYHFLLC